MTNEQQPRNPHAEDADGMSRELAAALRALGWAMPRTAAEVAAVEARLASEQVELPESLRDADALLQRRPGRVVPFRPREADAHEAARENLARAARDGAEISPEIEERMREDREQAERERDA
jgi:hypothetical protein